MTLNQYAAEKRLAIYEDLQAGLEPREGAYDEALLKEGRSKGAPQMGTTHYTPDELCFEFIYPDPVSTATILTVTLASPERIVFLPVPAWVVENIWQGDIEGTFQFESDALALLEAFRAELSAEGNPKWFEKQPAKRRE